MAAYPRPKGSISSYIMPHRERPRCSSAGPILLTCGLYLLLIFEAPLYTLQQSTNAANSTPTLTFNLRSPFRSPLSTSHTYLALPMATFKTARKVTLHALTLDGCRVYPVSVWGRRIDRGGTPLGLKKGGISWNDGRYRIGQGCLLEWIDTLTEVGAWWASNYHIYNIGWVAQQRSYSNKEPSIHEDIIACRDASFSWVVFLCIQNLGPDIRRDHRRTAGKGE